MDNSPRQVVIGFDFGTKYIGVAVGQSISKTASPLTTVKAINNKVNWESIDQIIAKWHPQQLIVGLPLNMDGSKQPITKTCDKFSKQLAARYKLPVDLVDERLSTWEAKQYLNLDKKTSNYTKAELLAVNATSAALLVEQWLHNH